jgi:K+ transporter
MKREALANFPYIWLTIGALLVFFAVFVVMVMMTWRRGSALKYQKLSELPLEADPTQREVNENEQ